MVRTLITNEIAKIAALFGADFTRQATGTDVAIICTVLAVIGIASLAGYIKCGKMFNA